MADRFWVGGTGNWSDDTNHWATSSGGAPGAGNKPTASDNAIFDAASNATAYTVTVNESAVCLDLNFSAAPATSGTITWAGTLAIAISGSLTMLTGMTRSYTGAITFNATTTGRTIDTKAINLNSAVTFNGAGGEWTLLSSFTPGAGNRTITHTQGTLNTNGMAVSCATFISSNANVRTLTFGASTISVNSSGTVFSTADPTNLTMTANTATIRLANATASDKVIATGGKDYNGLSVLLTGSGTGKFQFTGGGTFDDIECNTPPHTIEFTAGTTTTVNTFTVSGTSGNLMTIGSITAANHALVKAGGGTITCDFMSISRSDATPADTWYASNSTDGGNNSGWVFGAPVADFVGVPLTGTIPLSVTFTDLSTNSPTSWAWTFGDGQVSSVQNPTNIYASAGTYDVGLTATNALGANLTTKVGYITATDTVIEIDEAGEEQRRRNRRKQREELHSMISAAFDDDVEFAVAPQVREVAAPFVTEKAQKVEINLDRVRADVVAELVRLHARYIEDDDEDAIMVLH